MEHLVKAIRRVRSNTSRDRAVLAAISGIDASGKGYVTEKLAAALQAEGFNAAVINIDGWLNLPQVRFDPNDLPANFYRNAIRFDEMFEQLVLPLRRSRSIDIVAKFTQETSIEYLEHRYEFEDINVILLEGIFLFKRELIHHYDLKIWVDCPFETALERAIARSQEGLSPKETIRAYQTIYFPAQRIHIGLDDARSAADILIDN